MPQQVIRNGKTYYEYSPQELEEIRNKQIVDRYARNGQMKFAQSPFTQVNGKQQGHKPHLPS
jgi:glutamyl/glutaminyl-tRNA synthetase